MSSNNATTTATATSGASEATTTAATNNQSSTAAMHKDKHSVTKRLQQELLSLMMSGEKGVSAFPDGDNLFKWIGTIQGPVGTVCVLSPFSWLAKILVIIELLNCRPLIRFVIDFFPWHFLLVSSHCLIVFVYRIELFPFWFKWRDYYRGKFLEITDEFVPIEQLYISDICYIST